MKNILMMLVLLNIIHIGYTQNKIGFLYGTLLTYGFDQDFKEFNEGITNFPFNQIYDQKGKSAFKSGYGFIKGIFYERQISKKVSLQLNIYHSNRKVESENYYFGSNPSTALNGGYGTSISIFSYASTIKYRYKFFSKENFASSLSVGFGIDNYRRYYNHSYIISKELASINYVNSTSGVSENKFTISPKYFKYVFPVGISTSVKIWRGLQLNLDANYAYLTRGNYTFDTAWYYFEDPLHTIELNVGVGYEF